MGSIAKAQDWRNINTSLPKEKLFTYSINKRQSTSHITKKSVAAGNMKFQLALPMLATLVGAQGLMVEWFGCKQEYQITNVRDEGCTNVSGFKNDNLCGVKIIPHGHCDFYTSSCFRPGWTKRTCNARDGRCDTTAWPAIYSYQCFFD